MLTNDDLTKLLRKVVVDAGNQSKWAKAHGVDRQDVSAIFSGIIKMTKRVALALGYKQAWVKK